MLSKKILEETLGNKMTNKEFQRMISLFTELDNLLKKYERHITHEEYVEDCKFCFIHRGWYGVIESPCIEL